jgi:hypothetical protein
MKSDGDLSCVDDESDDDSDDYSDDADYDPGTIQDCIKLLADDMGIYSSHSTKYYLKQYGRINNITDKWQILDHIKAAVGPYPKKLEPVLELYRTHRFKFYCMSDQWYKYYTIMTELIDFDTIPITLIDLHFPIKQTPKYCAKLANTYTGSRTKAAKREDSY